MMVDTKLWTYYAEEINAAAIVINRFGSKLSESETPDPNLLLKEKNYD